MSETLTPPVANIDSDGKSIEELNKSIGVLGTEIGNYAKRVEEIIAMLKAKQSTNINDVAVEQEKQAKLAEKLAATNSQIGSLENQVEQNALVIDKKTREVADFTKNMASATEKIASKDEEVVRLSNDIKTKLGDITLLEGDIKIKNNELDELRTKLADKDSELQAKTLANSEQTGANETIIQRLTDEKKELEDAIYEQQQTLSKQIIDLNTQNTILLEKIARLEDALNVSKDKTAEDKAKVNKLEAQAQEMTEKIADLTRTVETNSNLQANIAKLNEDKAQLSEENSKCQKKIDALNLEIEKSKFKIEELIKRVQELTADLNKHKDDEPIVAAAAEDEVDNAELGKEQKNILIEHRISRNLKKSSKVLTEGTVRPEANQIMVGPPKVNSQSENIVNEEANLPPSETPKIKLQQVNKTDLKILDTANVPVEYDFDVFKDLPIQDGYNWVTGFIDSNGNYTTRFKEQQRIIKRSFMKGFIDDNDKTLNQKVRLFTRINATANNAEPQYFIEYKEPESSTASSTSSSTSSSTASSNKSSDNAEDNAVDDLVQKDTGSTFGISGEGVFQEPIANTKKIELINYDDYLYSKDVNPIKFAISKKTGLPISNNGIWYKGFVENDGNTFQTINDSEINTTIPIMMYPYGDKTISKINIRKAFTNINNGNNKRYFEHIPEFGYSYKEQKKFIAMSSGFNADDESDDEDETNTSTPADTITGHLDNKPLHKKNTTLPPIQNASKSKTTAFPGGQKTKAKSQKKNKTHKSRKPQKTNKHQKTNKRRKTHKRRNNKTNKRH
jgi:hypothetical protein